MSNRPSLTTRTIAVRIPLDVFSIMQRRADRKRIILSEYLKRKIAYDVVRPHGRRE